MTAERQRLGAEGERAAEHHLRRQGYAILERNYRCRAGEIDLIALHAGVVVFVEVKTRTGAEAGTPLEAVTRHKQRQIARAAQYYLSTHRLDHRDVRFDVVAVHWDGAGARCELIAHAFET
jgi:putative endonuclease